MMQNITVKIAERNFPLEIEAEKEEFIRAAVARINAEIEALQYDYREVELSEILRVVLLNEEKKLVDLEAAGAKEIDNIRKNIADLDAELGEYLSSR
ncbi:MAG: cell division protein ZapA [Bacteroidales bacterium]|nr:cell division protein ZapA [Candidatus Cacconaster caballi]